jgi:hypothetical protein
MICDFSTFFAAFFARLAFFAGLAVFSSVFVEVC